MSLLRAAIRACTVAALRDKTWAQSRVFDSDMTALADAVVGGPPQPYIVVYTDADDHTAVHGTELYEGDGRVLNIVLEIGVANAIVGTNDGQVRLQFAATDQGMELAVDMIAAQCQSALWGDPSSQWGAILKQLCWRILRAPSRRGGQAQAGIRFAARRITYVVNTLYDIPPGVVPDSTHPLMQFIALATGNPTFGVTDVGTILNNMLSAQNAPTWQQAQAYLGMGTASVEALQVPGVPLPYPNQEVPPLDTSDTNQFVPTELVSIDLTDEEVSDAEPDLPVWPSNDYLDLLSNEQIVNEPPPAPISD